MTRHLRGPLATRASPSRCTELVVCMLNNGGSSVVEGSGKRCCASQHPPRPAHAAAAAHAPRSQWLRPVHGHPLQVSITSACNAEIQLILVAQCVLVELDGHCKLCL